jgi:hypothetical protein
MPQSLKREARATLEMEWVAREREGQPLAKIEEVAWLRDAREFIQGRRGSLDAVRCRGSVENRIEVDR